MASPENTNVMLEDPRDDAVEGVLLEAVAEELPDPERSNIQGTTTCFPLPEDEDSVLVVLLGVVLELVLLGVVLPGVVLELALVSLPLVLPEAPETERIAKSIRPEAGLMITSLTVPRFWPDELVTWALLSSEARMCCCCCIRPVALSELPLDEPSELPDVLEEPWLLDPEPCWEPDE